MNTPTVDSASEYTWDFPKIAQLTTNCGLKVQDISKEVWREYEHGGVKYRIHRPIAMITRQGGTTHRIVDSAGIVHCHPVPGNGCALRWFNGDNKAPVNF